MVPFRLVRWPRVRRSLRMCAIFVLISSHILTLADPSDIAVSISNLFPVVYGGLYHFNPSTQGLLYLPMLIGSLLAECGTGQAGDRCVAADLSSPLGMLIGRRNADYASSNKGGDVGGPPYMNTLRRPGGEVRSDSTKVPEMRLILAFIGMLICIVRGLRSGSPNDIH